MNFLRNQIRRFDSVTVRCECPDGSTIEVKVSWTDRVSSICAEVERLKGIHEDAQELTQNGRNLMHESKILSSKIDPDVPIKVAVDRDIGFRDDRRSLRDALEGGLSAEGAVGGYRRRRYRGEPASQQQPKSTMTLWEAPAG